MDALSSAIFYLAEPSQAGKHDATAPVTDEFAGDVYLWLERSKSTANRIKCEHASHSRTVTALCALLAVGSIIFGVAVWPRHEQLTITKRVTFNECNGLLTIYGTRCN